MKIKRFANVLAQQPNRVCKVCIEVFGETLRRVCMPQRPSGSSMRRCNTAITPPCSTWRLHASVQETLRQTQDLSIGPVVAAGLLTNSSKSLLRYTAHHHFLTAPHFLTFTVSNLLTVQARTHGHVCRCIHTDICNLRGSVLGHFLHELFQEAHQVLRNIPWPEPASRLRPRSGSNAMIVVFQDAFLRVDAVQGN